MVKLGGERIALSVDFTNFTRLSSLVGSATLVDRGYLLVIHNVSDLIASGAVPLFALVAVGIPGSMGDTEIEALATGIREAANECGIVVVGGDTERIQGVSAECYCFGQDRAKWSLGPRQWTRRRFGLSFR